MTVDVDPLDLVDPERYARDGYPHDVWTRLRAEAPVARIEAPGYEPFWAITKHADIMQIAAQPDAVLERAGHHARPRGRAADAADRRSSCCSTRRGTGRCAAS